MLDGQHDCIFMHVAWALALHARSTSAALESPPPSMLP
jgi:hypothetical protein